MLADSTAGRVVCRATSHLVRLYRRSPSCVLFVRFALAVGRSAKRIATVSQTHQVFVLRRFPWPSGNSSGNLFFHSRFHPFICRAFVATYQPHQCCIAELFVVIRRPSGNLFFHLQSPLTYLRSVCWCIPPRQRFLLRHHSLRFPCPSFPVGRSSDPNSSSIVGRRLCPNFIRFPILFQWSGTDLALPVPVSDSDSDQDPARIRIGLYLFRFNVATNVTPFSEFVLIINKSLRSTLGFLLTISHSLSLCQSNVLPMPDQYNHISRDNTRKLKKNHVNFPYSAMLCIGLCEQGIAAFPVLIHSFYSRRLWYVHSAPLLASCLLVLICGRLCHFMNLCDCSWWSS